MKILMATADHLMIDRRILQEAKSLVSHGHEVTLLAGFECAARESYVTDGVRIERFVYDWGDSRFAPWARRMRLKSGTRLNSLAWRAFRYAAARLDFSSFDKFVFDRLLEYQVDVIHVHDYPMLRAGVELARFRKVPLVYDAHELYYAQTQLPIATQRRYMRRERKWIRYADRVLTVNPYIAKLMAKQYNIKVPDVILNAAPLLPRLHVTPLRERFNLTPSMRIVLYQGWISDNRGIDKLVLAARHFDEGTVLVIVGYGAYEEVLLKIVEENGLENRVHFFGGVDSDRLHPITCDADIGVIPYFGVDENNHFCSPNKLFEFAIAEIPFICNDLPFLGEIITRYGNGLAADLSDPAKIAMEINRVMNDDELLTRLRQGALVAKQELNWCVEEVKLLAIYGSLLT
ncbi:MAG: hypothetical protein A3F78_00815 [Burkholderiales bacterium RIFCSPLOWO2_12_FULL_61_40]|nr:MAG: hypothetical protein A3F78_00815 [Burkholderiales bacterium RIFCSPLOWO2_12_FULL_61_40]